MENKTLLVCGNLNIDRIYSVPYLPAEGQSTPVRAFREEFGGCGGNISIGAALLGVPVHLSSVVGKDFDPRYRKRLLFVGVDLSLVEVCEEAPSPYCIILSTPEGKQCYVFSEGAMVFECGNPPYRTYAEPNPDSHAAGAGDTFVSALALALAANADAPGAAELASAASTVVVGKEGTTTCSRQEIYEYFSMGDKYSPNPAYLLKQIEPQREQCRRIVFTNGCFDILHRGHITYLNQAKALGDILVVAVNSDEVSLLHKLQVNLTHFPLSFKVLHDGFLAF